MDFKDTHDRWLATERAKAHAMPSGERRVFADFILVDGKVVPDTVGTLVHKDDFMNDRKGEP